VSAEDLSGLAGLLKMAYFELAHLLRLRFMQPSTLTRLLQNEKMLYENIKVRGERGKIIFDFRNHSFVLNRHTNKVMIEKRRMLANRVAEVEYSYLTGSKGICFDGHYYHTSDQVEMVASNEFAFAVAGGTTIEIFEGGKTFTFPNTKAKKICWGAEGLFFVNGDDQLWIVKEFRYGGKKYETRSLTSVYKGLVPEVAELVCCDSLMCLVYRSPATTLRIDIVNGQSLSYSLDRNIEGRVLHFGVFYWSQLLTVFFVLDQNNGEISELYEKSFKI
jgi:hypothetical protein